MAKDPMLITVEAALAAKSGSEKRGFRPFAALGEGLQRRREWREAFSLLRAAMESGEPNDLDSAVGAFNALEPGQRGTVLAKALPLAYHATRNTFERDDTAQNALVLARYFREAAKMLPLDAEGERITAPYADAITAFVRIADSKQMSPNESGLRGEAVLACAEALWELEYGSAGFWEDRLEDFGTRAFTITKLLEMPETPDFKDSGYALLRKELAIIAADVARSRSEKKVDFIRRMLADADPQVQQAAVKSALYLSPAPPRLLEGVPGLKEKFVRAGEQLAEEATCFSDRPERAAIAVDGLITLALNNVMPYSPDQLSRMLRPLSGSREYREYLFAMTGLIRARAGENMRAANAIVAPYLARKAEKQKAQLEKAVAAAELAKNLPAMAVLPEPAPEDVKAEAEDDGPSEEEEQAMCLLEHSTKLMGAAASIENAVMNSIISELENPDADVCINAASEVVGLFACGRAYLRDQGVIGYVAMKMEGIANAPSEAEEDGDEKPKGPSAAQRDAARGVLGEIDAAGVDAGEAASTARAFVARAKEAAEKMARVKVLLGQLELAGDEQFDAAMEIVQIYSSGLNQLLQDGTIARVAQEMVEVGLDPGGETEAEKAGQRTRAQDVVNALARAGVEIDLDTEGDGKGPAKMALKQG